MHTVSLGKREVGAVVQNFEHTLMPAATHEELDE